MAITTTRYDINAEVAPTVGVQLHLDIFDSYTPTETPPPGTITRSGTLTLYGPDDVAIMSLSATPRGIPVQTGSAAAATGRTTFTSYYDSRPSPLHYGPATENYQFFAGFWRYAFSSTVRLVELLAGSYLILEANSGSYDDTTYTSTMGLPVAGHISAGLRLAVTSGSSSDGVSGAPQSSNTVIISNGQTFNVSVNPNVSIKTSGSKASPFQTLILDGITTTASIDWGDGSSESVVTPSASISHSYAGDGTYYPLATGTTNYGLTDTLKFICVVSGVSAEQIGLLADHFGWVLTATKSGTSTLIRRHDGTSLTTVATLANLSNPTLVASTRTSDYFLLAQSSSQWQLLKSADCGSTWNFMSAPFDTATYKAVVICQTGGFLLAAAIHKTSGATVVRLSSDDGATWTTQPATGVGSGYKALSLAPSRRRAGVFLLTDTALKFSNDLGANWTNA